MAIKSFGQACVKDIDTFESFNGFRLPDDYVAFLLKYNGGIVEPYKNSIYIKDLKEEVNIDVLFGMNTTEPELSVELWLNDYKKDMPQNSLIIGDSYQHGFIVLLCTGEDIGVYYWDHAYVFPCSTDETNTYFITDTFSNFIKNIE